MSYCIGYKALNMHERIVEYKFLILLLSLVGLILVAPYIETTPHGRWTVSIFLVFSLVAVVFTMIQRRLYLIIACILALIDIVAFGIYAYYAIEIAKLVKRHDKCVFFSADRYFFARRVEVDCGM